MSEFCPICEEEYKDCPHTINEILKHFINPKEMPESLSNQMKLLRIDFANTFKDIVIIKKHIHDIKKMVREIKNGN